MKRERDRRFWVVEALRERDGKWQRMTAGPIRKDCLKYVQLCQGQGRIRVRRGEEIAWEGVR